MYSETIAEKGINNEDIHVDVNVNVYFYALEWPHRSSTNKDSDNERHLVWIK